MKKVLFIVAVTSIVLSSCKNNRNSSSDCSNDISASEEQMEQIVRTIDFYAEGFRQGDPSITARAFADAECNQHRCE
jgi:protein involved in sex pheromone biosynthesis